MPLSFFLLSAALASAGVAALLLIRLRWAWVEGFAKRSQAKPAVALCRALLAGTGFLGRDIAGWWTAALAIVGWLAWEIADWWAAEKLKDDKAAEEAKKADRISELEARVRKAETAASGWELLSRFRANLLFALCGLVNTKNQQIRRSLAGKASKVAIQRARAAFAPEDQTGFILEQLALFLSRQLPAEKTANRQNFRVWLFVETDGVLSPLDGFDLNASRHRPFASYGQHADLFRLDNTTDPAPAVRCIRQRRLLLVSDCAADPTFPRLDEGQDSYLKSLAAYPIIGYGVGESGDLHAALVIDTNAAGHFREDDRESLELILHEFAARLRLEDAIRTALS